MHGTLIRGGERRCRGAGVLIGSLVTAFLLIFGGGCAQIDPPSGGPEDKTPPTILSTYPESLAVGVGLTDSLVISFSESMNKGTVKDWLFLSPEVDRLQYSWDGWDVTIRAEAPLQQDRTYVLLLASDVRDRRRNSLAAPVAIPFATGDALDMGKIQGRVITGLLQPKGHFVFAWTGEPVPVDSLLVPPGSISEALRRGQTDTKGEFVLPHLPVGAPLTLAVLYDAEGNRSVDEKADFWACFPSPVTLIDTLPEETGLEIYLVYPDEPGSINGTILDSLCISRSDPVRIRLRGDSLRALLAPPGSTLVDNPEGLTDTGVWDEWREWADDTLDVRPDSLDPAAIEEMLAGLESTLATALDDSHYCARPIWVELFPSPDSASIASVRVSGDFELKGIAPGAYWLRAYRDLDLNGEPTGGEPESDWMGPFEIEPVHSIDSLEVLLPSLAKPWPETLLPKREEPFDSTQSPPGEPAGIPADDPADDPVSDPASDPAGDPEDSGEGS